MPGATGQTRYRWSAGRPAQLRYSHRQPMASLRPARPDDGAPGLARHPLAESVGLGPFAYVWLIGPLHFSNFLPRPEPWTVVSRAAGGPITGIRAFPYMLGAIGRPL